MGHARMSAMNVESNELKRYHDAIRYLEDLRSTSVGADYMSDQSRPWVFLERTQSFLDSIGNPEKGFKYIHITGTSGKGTVATMTHEALVSAGKSVGLFTSPYVVAATEKIRVDDLFIPPLEFADILEGFKPHIALAQTNETLGRPTYFEIFFAIALAYFKRMHCEWVVLEVGAGGRYDATNIIDSPVVTAITNIDYDHMHILGNTLLSIAGNKAGIIKKGSTFFTTEKRPAIVKLFKKECARNEVICNVLPVSPDYQENNKTLVRAICGHIGLEKSHIEAGVQARLPGRFETMQERPRVVLDGAHNRAKMRSSVANVKKLSFAKLHLILALKDDKKVESVAKEIVSMADTVTVTSFQNEFVRCIEPNLLRAGIKEFLKNEARVQVVENSTDALEKTLAIAKDDDLVLVTGSFYLVGELRIRWYSEEWVLQNRRSFA